MVLQVIKDSQKQSTQLGGISLAARCFVIPLIVLLPMLSSDPDGSAIAYAIFFAILLRAMLALCVIFNRRNFKGQHDRGNRTESL